MLNLRVIVTEMPIYLRRASLRLSRLSTLRQPLRKTARHMARKFRRIFYSARERANRGIAWPNRTRAYKWPLMRKTGTLSESFEYEAKSDTTAKIWTAVPYAIYHQEGRPDQGLPQRKFMNVVKSDAEFMKNQIRRHLMLKNFKEDDGSAE